MGNCSVYIMVFCTHLSVLNSYYDVGLLAQVLDSLSFCPSDQQSFMSELDSQVSTAFGKFHFDP